MSITNTKDDSNSSASKSNESGRNIATASKIPKLSQQQGHDCLRKFCSEWEEEYFVVPTIKENLPQCLICMEIISANKKYNIARHYKAHNKANYDKKYPRSSESRMLYIAELKSNLQHQRKLLKTALTETQCVTLATYQISMKIAKYRKPFTEGEFIKECFLDTAKV